MKQLMQSSLSLFSLGRRDQTMSSLRFGLPRFYTQWHHLAFAIRHWRARVCVCAATWIPYAANETEKSLRVRFMLYGMDAAIEKWHWVAMNERMAAAAHRFYAKMLLFLFSVWKTCLEWMNQFVPNQQLAFGTGRFWTIFESCGSCGFGNSFGIASMWSLVVSEAIFSVTASVT